MTQPAPRTTHPHVRRPSAGTAHARRWRAWRPAPVIALVVALLALATTGGSSAANGAVRGSNRVAFGAHPRIERADLHVDDLPSAPGLEVDLEITETRDDCETPLQGQVCLRYGISQDDAPIQIGYGLIPISAVRLSSSAFTLATDTRHDPHVTCLAGAGGLISLTWSVPLGVPHPTNQRTALAVATVQGSIMGYTIPNTHVTAGVLITSGT